MKWHTFFIVIMLKQLLYSLHFIICILSKMAKLSFNLLYLYLILISDTWILLKKKKNLLPETLEPKDQNDVL
jgi:hypothetical protein